MLRITAFTCVLAVVVPLAPFGCPTSATPPDDSSGSTERGVLTVSAAALDADTGGAVGKATFRKQVNLRAALTSSAAPPVTYAWAQTAGPGVQISNPGQADATLTVPSVKDDAEVVFTVTASDAGGAVGRANVSFTILADPNYTPYDWSTVVDPRMAPGPEADAGARQRGAPGDTITLDGSGSTGNQLVYRWRQTSGRSVDLQDTDTVSPSFVVPEYSATAENWVVFELAVTDARDRTAKDTVRVLLGNPQWGANEVAVVTSLGEFRIELYPNEAPLSVANFLDYVDDGFYDNLIFHRVISEFVIQTGGFGPGLTRKTTGAPIKNESDNGLSNTRGTVAMARTNAPDSATSQWYVNLVDNTSLDYTSTQAGYTVFGRVLSGMETVDAIGAVETESRQGFNDVPVDDVVVYRVYRE